MKISYIDCQFVLGDAPDSDLLIAKGAGFVFHSATATWRGDYDSVDGLRKNSLRLASGLTITELALEQFKAGGKVVLDAIAASRAQDSDVFVPAPDGQEYLPFQRAGIAYAVKILRGRS